MSLTGGVVFSHPAGIRAKFDFAPDLLPLLAPDEGSTANDTWLGGQVGFFPHLGHPNTSTAMGVKSTGYGCRSLSALGLQMPRSRLGIQGDFNPLAPWLIIAFVGSNPALAQETRCRSSWMRSTISRSQRGRMTSSSITARDGNCTASMTQAAMSSGCIMRARAAASGTMGRRFKSGVLMSPGKMPMARTPRVRSSALIAWVRPARPNFDIT